ncbi:MAG: DUF721 domain-containing protein [Bacteroidales bacterium]|nr:DUF721 domain-containing protein [Bacteroidales bacterium]
MPAGNEKSLGEIIREVIHHHGLENKLTEKRIFSSWESIMGQPIAKYTVRLSYKDGRLTVNLSSPALRNELSLAKQKIIDMINKEMGEKLVSDIQFR